MKAKLRAKPVATEEFRSAEKSGKILPLRKEIAGVQVRAKEDGTVDFIMSTSDKDRYNDVIQQDGWDVKDFLNNPVLLWAHDYGVPPVGKVGATAVEDGKLKAKNSTFQDREVFEFGWAVGEMYKRGFMNAVSVGFLPVEYTWDEELNGIRFYKQSLMELSAVPVPANPHALVEAKSAGLWTPKHQEWVDKILSAEKDGPEFEYAERAYRTLRAPQVQVPVQLNADDDDGYATLVEAVRELTQVMRALPGQVEDAVRRGMAPPPTITLDAGRIEDLVRSVVLKDSA